MTVKVKILVLAVEDELVNGIHCRLKDEATLGDLINNLSREYPLFKQMLTNGEGELLPYIKMVVNGLAANKIDLSLAPGGEVVFFPAIAGG